MERSLVPVLLGLSFCFPGAGVDAATYFVDNSGALSCSDTPGDGSESNPWCTMFYAVGRIQAGDTLNVKSGTYNGGFTVSGLAATAGGETVIQKYPGADVTIRGPGFDGGRVRFENCHYLIFRGFEVTNFNQGIFVTGASSHIKIESVTVHAVGQEGIHVKENSSHILIDDSLIYDTDMWSYNGEGIYIGTGSGGPLDNTHHVTVSNCTIYNVVDEAIEFKPGTHDCVAEGNLVYNTTTSQSFGAIEINQHSAGVQTWGSNPNHIVRNNTVHSSDTAIRAGTGCSVYNNVIYRLNPGSYGILVNNISGDSYDRLIYHNTINLPSSETVVISSGSTDLANNIGPNAADNTTADDSYFVSTTVGSEDFHLIQGSAPMDAGIVISGFSEPDKDGISRPLGTAPDMGAYELDSSFPIFADDFESGNTTAWSRAIP